MLTRHGDVIKKLGNIYSRSLFLIEAKMLPVLPIGGRIIGNFCFF